MSTDRPTAEFERRRESGIESVLRDLAGPLLHVNGPPPRNRAAFERELLQTSAGVHMDAARYRTLVELLPAITFMAVFDGGLQEAYVSPQIEAILGYSQAEWLSNPVLWYERLHPGDKQRWNLEFAETVATGAPFRAAYRFLARDGRTIWLHGEVRIARDEAGQPQFLYGIGIDITKIKEAEQRVRDYSERLERTNRELEQFAYVASHDLQEPLRTIVSYSQIISEDYRGKLDQHADEHFTRIINAAKRMKSLIQSVLEFSRIGHGDVRANLTDFNQVLQEAVANLDIAIQESGAVITQDQLPHLNAIRPYIVLLFQNLVGNALKYRGPEPPRIHVSAANDRNGSWVFAVRDNGIGIDPRYREKIFVIFQRLHGDRQHAGTGIGLAICKKIVEYHGGRIWVEPNEGRGSIFRFTLPVNPIETMQ